MKQIFNISCIVLIFLFLNSTIQAQSDNCEELIDPLYDVNSLVDIDLCCGVKYTKIQFSVDVINPGSSYTLNNFQHPNGVWIPDAPGYSFNDLEVLAAKMTEVSNIIFKWNSTEHVICGYVLSSTNPTVSVLEVCNSNGNNSLLSPCPGIESKLIPDVCPIEEPEIDVHAILSGDVDPNFQLFNGDAGNYTTDDLVILGNNSSILDGNGNPVGPSGNTVGALLNMAISTGAFPYGAGCQNLNCFLDQLESTAIGFNQGATAQEINATAESLNVEDPPSGNSWSEEVRDSALHFLQTVDVVDYINSNLGIQLPNIPCPNRIGPKVGTNENGSMRMNSNTQADQDYFSSAIPGIGKDGAQVGNPSPSALNGMSEINAGVNLYNGSQSTSIPLYNLLANDLSIPISLNSTNNGLKVDDYGSTVGHNWNLSAGGSISRVVKGLPDEYVGTVRGTGPGRIPKLHPRFEFPANLGFRLDFIGKSKFCNDLEGKVKKGFCADVKLDPSNIYIKPCWSPQRPNMITITVGIKVATLFAILPLADLYLEIGFNIGLGINYELGNIAYEEDGTGFLYLSGIGGNFEDIDEKKDVLEDIHHQRMFDDARFFNDKFATWEDWSDAFSLFVGQEIVERSTKLDTEPDEFHFNAGGYSGMFKFNVDGSTVLFPHIPGLDIKYTSTTNGGISSFTITTPEGIEYSFGGIFGNAVDVIENTDYYLPNFYTYPQLGQTPSTPELFGKAEIAINQLPHYPYIGDMQVLSYGATYERNYKIMEAPSYNAAWHLTKVSSLLSNESIDLEYDSKSTRYYSSKNFTYKFPNFDVTEREGGPLTTEPNTDLNPFKLRNTQWENGRAELAYSATETELLRWDLKQITANRGETAHFFYETDRPELIDDQLLDKIIIKRSGELYKGWKLEYDCLPVESSSANCNGSTIVDGRPVISIKDELAIDLGKPYDMQPFEYNDYLFFTLGIECFSFPFRDLLPFSVGVMEFGQRSTLSEFGSLMEVKALNRLYDSETEAQIFTGEKKRSFLERVQEIDRDGGTHPFVTDVNYVGGRVGLPKRYSIYQDVFGYHIPHKNHGTLLPDRFGYTSITGEHVSFGSDGTDLLFGFDNVIYHGEPYLENDAAQLGALKEVDFASGSSIQYTYESNILPNGQTGAGIRVANLSQSPGKTTSYLYETPTMVVEPIIASQNEYDYFYEGLEQRVTIGSKAQNELIQNGNAQVGYEKVTEVIEGFGSIEHSFTSPQNYREHFSANNSIINVTGYTNKETCLLDACDDFTPNLITGIPPNLSYPVNDYQNWLFGINYRQEIFNNDGTKRRIIRSDYDYIKSDDLSITVDPDDPLWIPSLSYFKTNMYQFNYQGNYLENWLYSEILNLLPNVLDGGVWVNYFVDLISGVFGSVINHPYKYINRHYSISDRQLGTGFIRKNNDFTVTFYPDGSDNNFSTIYAYADPRTSQLASSLTTFNDGNQTKQEFLFIDDGELDDTFGADALSFLREEITYFPAVVTKDYINSRLVNTNYTALDRVDDIVVPLANYTVRGGTLDLAGLFSDYNGDGKPQTYTLSKYNQSGVFPSIFLEWNTQLQVTKRRFGEFVTDYTYDQTYFELKKIKDPDGIISEFIYDPRARLKEESGLNGKHNTKYIYNIEPGNNFVQSILEFGDGLNPSQPVIKYLDGIGRPLSTIRQNDGAPLEAYAYDDLGQIIYEYHIESGKLTTVYEESLIPKVITEIDGAGNKTISEYFSSTADYYEDLTFTDPNDHVSFSYFSSLGTMRKSISPEGSTTDYTYNELGQPTSIAVLEGGSYEFAYNEIDKLCRKKVPGAKEQFIWWNNAFQPAASLDGNGNGQIMVHDEYNRLTNVFATGMLNGADPCSVVGENQFGNSGDLLIYNEYSSGHTWLERTKEGTFSGADPTKVSGVKSTTFIRDEIGRPYEIYESYPVGGMSSKNTYTDAGVITKSEQKILGEPFNFDYTFDDVLRTEDIMLTIPETDITERVIASLRYNSADLVITKYLGQYQGDQFLQKVDYGYDGANRLIRINKPGTDECNGEEDVCDISLTINVREGETPHDCNTVITHIESGTLVYEVPGHFDLLDPSGDLEALMTDALLYFGVQGEISVIYTHHADGVVITVTIEDTPLDWLAVRSLCEEIPQVFSEDFCCQRKVSESGMEYYPESLRTQNRYFSDNIDLFVEGINYDGWDVDRVFYSSGCPPIGYNYTYDGNHRIKTMSGSPPVFTGTAPYSSSYTYDLAGNFKTIKRRGFLGGTEYGPIDDLTFTMGDNQGQGQILAKVEDEPSANSQSDQTLGFSPLSKTYEYDFNGNIIKETDHNGESRRIINNLINLPGNISGKDGTMELDFTFGTKKYRKFIDYEDASIEDEEWIYVGGMEKRNENNVAFYFGDGRVIWRDGEPFLQYTLQDHLGSTAAFFEDKNLDGEITTELMSDDPKEIEVLQRNFYYPFGMPMDGIWNDATDPEMDYLYNGKENDEELGLNWMHYGFRYYDPAIGRFTGVDPISEEFAWVTNYNYAENSPIGNIDLWGLQKVSINDTRDTEGNITQRNVTVSVDMKILNLSSKDNYRFNGSLQKASTKAFSSFSTSFIDNVLDSPQTGMTDNKVPINVKFILSVKQVSSLNQVNDKDFVGIIVDQLTDGKETVGRANFNDNLSILEADYMDGSSPEVLLHELGHSLGLEFDSKDKYHTNDGKGLMGANVNGQTDVSSKALISIYKTLPVTGGNRQKTHPQTKDRARDFFDENAARFDKTKAKNAGFN